jgi:hypothetical protein
MSIIKSISGASQSGHGTALLYAGLIGLLLSDIIPTPADAIFFKYESKLKDQLEAKEITPKQYWLRNAAAYYLLNPIWWLIVILIISNIPGDAGKKLKFTVGILAAGLVVAVIYKNIKKDEAKDITSKYFK